MEAKEIFQAIITEATDRLLNVIADKLGTTTLTEIVAETQATVNRLGARLIEEIVTITDERYNAQRNKRAIRLRNTVTRRLQSTLGEINLTRRLYYDNTRKKYFYAVDEMLGIEPYSRIEGGLKAKLISDATLTSYGKASKLNGDCVSRQTVNNIIKKVSSKQLDIAVQKRKFAKQVFIEADEDHIHLNTGAAAEVKLVYVHEGRRRVNRGRTELINARYFASTANGAEIWDDVYEYIDERYTKNAEVHLSGDGALWIKAARKIIPNLIYHTDKFHVYKSVTRAVGGNKKEQRRILNCIRGGEREKLRELYLQRWKAAISDSQRRLIEESFTYINRNFKSINLLSEYSCSAEGHISHVLSARLSSRPMAWSLAGAEKIAKLRAYYYNKGSFVALTRPYIESVENTGRKPFQFRANYYPKTQSELPQAHVVGRDGVTNWVSFLLRRALK